jgi:hypothetical protein
MQIVSSFDICDTTFVLDWLFNPSIVLFMHGLGHTILETVLQKQCADIPSVMPMLSLCVESCSQGAETLDTTE